MGLLPRLQELSYQVEEVRYVDESGRRRAGLNYARFERAVNGRLLSIMRPDLELALRERVVDKVDLRYGYGITTQPAACASLSPTERLSAPTCWWEPMESTRQCGAWFSATRKISSATSATTPPHTSSTIPRSTTTCTTGSASPTPQIVRWASTVCVMARLPRSPCIAAPIPHFPKTRSRQCTRRTRRSAGSFPGHWRGARRLLSCTTTRSHRSRSHSGAVGGSPWSATPARRSRCSPDRVPHSRSLAPTCSATSWRARTPLTPR